MKKYIPILFFIFLFQSCSMNKFIIRQTGAILDYGVIALYEENDLKIAEQALASDIKLIEGMIKGDPENKQLLLLATQSLAGYALGFAEDESPERAKNLYLRARDYGMQILRQNSLFAKNEDKPLEQFSKSVSNFEKENIDALFWAAFAWAAWINLSLDDPQAFVDLVKVQVMMQRVHDLDETYFFGSTHLFFGSVWGTKPRMLGGDPEKAKEHFEKNLQITEGKFLLTYIYYAKFYAIKILDEELFDELIKKVNETPADVLPEYQLMNVIAKKKAAHLVSLKEDLF